jgi:hypothetical protein
MMFPYIYDPTNHSLTVIIDNEQFTLNRETHPNFDKVIDAIRSNDSERARQLIDITAAVSYYAKGFLEVKNGDVYWDDKPFHNSLTDRLMEMLRQEIPVEPLVEFLHNLKKNPSKRAVDELYDFLECNSLPITPDGCFLAYKKVRNDYKDIHSGTMDNSVGKVVEMTRNEVDEDKNRTCSSGLHFCSLAYLPYFGNSHGDRVVIVKINPRDVVSIPADYDNAKGRCCRYEVVGEHKAEKGKDRDTTEAFNSPVHDWEPKAAGRGYTEESEYAEARAVYIDSQGRFRFADNGQYASVADFDLYVDWCADVSSPAGDFQSDPRAVYVDRQGRYRFADNGQYASYTDYQAYLNR